jgi:hypothetical protein
MVPVMVPVGGHVNVTSAQVAVCVAAWHTPVLAPPSCEDDAKAHM